jgi:hypothetical protein
MIIQHVQFQLLPSVDQFKQCMLPMLDVGVDIFVVA